MGKAVAGLNAQVKGRRLGIFKPHEEKPKIAAAARSAPSLSEQAQQYAGDNRGPSYGATAPGPEFTRPYGQGGEDRGPGRRGV